MINAAFKLEDSGFTREQVSALTEFMTGSVATKEDIVRLEGKIETQGERLDGKINLVYWMLGLLIAANLSLVMKAFF